MMSQVVVKRQFVWTVIPAGRVEEVGGVSMGRFSVLLTPRLMGPSEARLTVADFGMRDWPQRAAGLQFKVFRAGTLLHARQEPMIGGDRRPVTFPDETKRATWKELFPENRPVRPYRPVSYDKRPVREFPASEAGTVIRDAYGNTSRVLAEWDGTAAARKALRESALQKITKKWQAGLWPSSDAESDKCSEQSPLRKAYNFYCRNEPDFQPIAPLAVVSSDELDFHDTVARLADHPILLRSLGLLFDFVAPASQLTGPEPREIRIKPLWSVPTDDWRNAEHEDVSPRTAYELAGSRFVPAASDPRESALGLLPLAGTGATNHDANGRYELLPFDVDGAALRLVSTARPGVADLPALRSAGFALIEKARKAEHVKRLKRAAERSTVSGLEGTPLTAENLTAGYRVDLFDGKTGTWHSLSQRRIGYRVGLVSIDASGLAGGRRGFLEEGCVRPDSVTTGAGPDDALYLHQTVLRWNGWSTVVPRPERIPDPPNLSQVPLDHRAEVVPGSLPRLQFGRNYRMRVRLADLSGGGLRMNEAGTNEQQTEPFTHRRFEPVPPPDLLPTSPYADGEAQDIIVLRSDGKMSVGEFAAVYHYRNEDTRLILPPKCSLELAMQHKVNFDGAFGPATSDSEIDRFLEIAKRADCDVGDIPGARRVRSGLDSAEYFVLPERPVPVPWLPDPASRSATLHVRSRPIDPFSGQQGSTSGFAQCSLEASCIPILYPWKKSWPNRMPISLKVVEADSGCSARMTLDGDHRTVTIALGPAEQATLDIVSCPESVDVTSLGIAHWAGATTDPSQPVTQHVYHGKNPMVSPPRTVTVVHAVQRPLKIPGGRMIVKRAMKDTHAILATRELDLHIPSTGRIDIVATWTDHVDSPGTKPSCRKMEAVVGSFDVKHVPLYHAMSEIRQEFGDTRCRTVTYQVKAISRFRDYFGRITEKDSQACTVEGTLAGAIVPCSVRPSIPVVRYVMPTFRWSGQGKGTANQRSTRRGGGLRVFLERPWFLSGEGEKLAVLVWPQATPLPTAETQRHLSLAGRDPIRENSGQFPALLTPDHINATCQRTFLPASNQYVSAAICDVQFDDEADCWYADVDLSPLVESSYFPFVRLGVARYQANTVQPDDRLSPPIVCEPTQLFPHRDLTVSRSSGAAIVNVSGLGVNGASPTSIKAELQVFEGPAAAAGDGLIGPSGWRKIAERRGLLGGNLHFDIPQSGSRLQRIFVTEAESYQAVGLPATDSPTRLVYADSVFI